MNTKKKFLYILLPVIVVLGIALGLIVHKVKTENFEARIHSLHVSETKQSQSVISSEEAATYMEWLHTEDIDSVLDMEDQKSDDGEKQIQYTLYSTTHKHKDAFEVILKMLSKRDDEKEYVLAVWLESNVNAGEEVEIEPYMLKELSQTSVVGAIGGYSVKIKGPDTKAAAEIADRNGYLEYENGRYSSTEHIKIIQSYE